MSRLEVILGEKEQIAFEDKTSSAMIYCNTLKIALPGKITLSFVCMFPNLFVNPCNYNTTRSMKYTQGIALKSKETLIKEPNSF